MTDPIDPDHHASRPPPFPRWVIWLGIGVLVAVLLVLGLHLLTGGGMVNHGGTPTGMRDSVN